MFLGFSMFAGLLSALICYHLSFILCAVKFINNKMNRPHPTVHVLDVCVCSQSCNWHKNLVVIVTWLIYFLLYDKLWNNLLGMKLDCHSKYYTYTKQDVLCHLVFYCIQHTHDTSCHFSLSSVQVADVQVSERCEIQYVRKEYYIVPQRGFQWIYVDKQVEWLVIFHLRSFVPCRLCKNSPPLLP